MKIQTPSNRFADQCVASCQKLVAQIHQIRNNILMEYRDTVKAAHRNLLQLALNEAEALAWETSFPQLVFPSLAQEKIQAVAHWETHQQVVRKSSATLRFAA